VGLGNPGRAYARTRHNIGFEVVDLVAETLGVTIRKRRFGGKFGAGEYAGRQVLLLKPWRWMNLSGEVVATAVGFYKLALSDLLVVTDDMALEPGRIRIRRKGSAGGHNGLADIIAKVGSDAFARLRVGIGRDEAVDAVDYVLSRPSPAEREVLEQAMQRARDAVLCWIREGIEAAMNCYNAPPAER